MTPLDAAVAGIRQGYSRVHIPHRSKRPIPNGWERLEITVDVASQYFNGAAQNIGLLLADRFGSTNVEGGGPEAITAPRELLPETSLIFCRQSFAWSQP
jgi:hypothetical protein